MPVASDAVVRAHLAAFSGRDLPGIESVTTGGERRHLDRAAFYTVDEQLITSARIYDVRD